MGDGQCATEFRGWHPALVAQGFRFQGLACFKGSVGLLTGNCRLVAFAVLEFTV